MKNKISKNITNDKTRQTKRVYLKRFSSLEKRKLVLKIKTYEFYYKSERQYDRSKRGWRKSKCPAKMYCFPAEKATCHYFPLPPLSLFVFHFFFVPKNSVHCCYCENFDWNPSKRTRNVFHGESLSIFQSTESFVFFSYVISGGDERTMKGKFFNYRVIMIIIFTLKSSGKVVFKLFLCSESFFALIGLRHFHKNEKGEIWGKIKVLL